jgi:hypothetical protein
MPAFRPIVLFFFILLVSCHSKAQQPASVYPPYNPDAPELVDIQRTIDDAMDDVEDSLKLKGTFKPFAVVILANDSIAEIHAGKEQKDSFSMQDLEEELSIDALKGNYKVVTIFYPAKSTNNLLEPDTKIVAIHAEHTDDDFAYRFEYPYSKPTPKTIVFGEPLANFEEQVMFKP